VPIASGAVAGEVQGVAQRQPLTGLADPRFKFSIGLHGAPALTLSEFARAPRRGLVVGAGLTVAAPWGQYKPTQLVNLGYNRWGFKPEIAASRQVGRWTSDGILGVWLFTENRSYHPGSAVRRQDPVATWQGHVSYALAHRSWIAFDGTWFAGGQTRVDPSLNPDEQRNSRLGATLSVPLSSRQSLSSSTARARQRGAGRRSIHST
jgi:hypothetical protein